MAKRWRTPGWPQKPAVFALGVAVAALKVVIGIGVFAGLIWLLAWSRLRQSTFRSL